jgi:hypothetical protein
MFFIPGYKVTGVMKTFFVFFQKSNIKFDTKNENSDQIEEEKSNNAFDTYQTISDQECLRLCLQNTLYYYNSEDKIRWYLRKKTTKTSDDLPQTEPNIKSKT